MPFQSIRTPSIQLGLLRAISESHGFLTDAFHLSLDFARRVGYSFYEELAQMRRRLIGEWLFSNEAFREEAPDRDARLLQDFAADVAAQIGSSAIQSPTAAVRDRLTLLQIRNEVIPAYLDAMMAETDWGKFRVVGFISVFQQTAASIALARRIKEAYPQVRIVFGGSNFDDEMGLELIRKVPCIDHAVIGEVDVAFPELLVALAEQKSPLGIPGVASRVDSDVAYGGDRPLLDDMDALPTPRYDDYFERAEATGLLSRSRTRSVPIPFESTRRCCWCKKHNCKLCGLNGGGMKFRAKSVARVESELSELARSYGSFTFTAVDNIVDADYLQTLFPRIVAGGKDYQFFYKVKSNLTREHLKAMRAAGLVVIQPEIDSFSSHVLQLMKKGMTAAQNVNSLRWATYYGVWMTWNIVWGFPGETAEDYVQQAKLVRHLIHLNPPQSAGARVPMERFSPLYRDERTFLLEFRRPDASYSYVYPFSFDLEKIAYFFEYKLRGALHESAYASLSGSLQAWMDIWKAAGVVLRPHAEGDDQAREKRAPTTRFRPALTFSHSDDFLQIVDLRKLERTVSTFEGPLARLYKAASDCPVGAAKAAEMASAGVSVKSVERALDEFCERGLMMRDGDKFLSLALPATLGR
jgi:ribosomal peptide maturation radical SAM protein 1